MIACGAWPAAHRLAAVHSSLLTMGTPTLTETSRRSGWRRPNRRSAGPTTARLLGRIRPELSIRSHDTCRLATRLTMLGLLVGALLALVGVPRVDLHGPLHHVGIMDPLCGGTRAAFLLAHGRWGAAWTYNPVVFPLAIGGVAMLCRTAVGAASGRWVTLHLADRRPLIVLLVVAVAALAVRQQLHAELLTSGWTGLSAL